MLDAELIHYNKLGIVPGPKETESEFLIRAENCLHLRTRIKSELASIIPLRAEELAPSQIFAQPLEKTERLCGIRPDWVPIFFSNHRLLPWHGGCAWIFQLNAKEPPMALFQLRQAFSSKETYLGLYHRNELIEHELLHVGRMCFHEPKFEEIIAYQTSRSWLRRWFGPLFQSSMETVIFLISLLFVVGVDVYALSVWGPEGYLQVASLKFLPAFLLAIALGRLLLHQWQFQRCLHNLTKFFHDRTHAHQLIYRLTDQEIITLGKENNIANYANRQADQTLRWRLLNALYFSKNHHG